MANKFVWSGATGAGDGSKWEDAYTSLMRDWGAEAGFTPGTDFIYVRSVHAESTAAALTITGSTAEGSTAPCRVISCVGAATGTSPGALATGASVTATTDNDINVDESIYIYGVEFYASDFMVIGVSNTDQDIFCESCRFELTGVGAGDHIYVGVSAATAGQRIKFLNCTFDFNQASQEIYPRQGRILFQGCVFEYASTEIVGNAAVNGDEDVIFEGCDFSNLTSHVINTSANVNLGRKHLVSRCVLGTGVSVTNSGTIDVPGFSVWGFHCQIGTDADPAYHMEYHDKQGKIVTDTARYRTGGGKDSERTNPICWDMDTTVGSVRGYPSHPLVSPPISAWTDGDASTAHTYRIAIASDATIQDDEIWMELTGPNDAATDSKAVFQTSRVAPLTTASNLATDSGSTWTGSGVGTKQYMEVTYTPDKPGPIEVVIYMAKASDNIYIDPLIQIDP